MRIITGLARGTKLQTLEGTETRPTSEMVKEAVFSMLQFEIDGKRVLDLFGGSGQLGLEALSRGARKAVMIDQNPAAVAIIKANAQKTKLFEKSVVLCTDYKAYIRGNGGKEQFDIVFLDPPYASGFLKDATDRLIRANMLAKGAVVVCESDDKEPVEAEGLVLRKHAKYGRIYLTVLENPIVKEEEV